MKKSIVFALVAAFLLTLVAGCGGSKPAAPTEQPKAAETPKPEAPKFKAREFKVGVTASDISTWTEGAKKFKEIVETETGGVVKVSIFPNSQLASGNQIKELEMLQNGAIDMTITSTIFYSNLEQKTSVVSLPFLFAGYGEVDKFMNGPLGEELLKLVEAKNIKGLALGENGFRPVTNSKHPIKAPADLAGLKIRIPGIKMYTSIYKAMGANPLTMSFGEVFGALQQKVVDGQENPFEIIASSKLYEVQKHMTIWNYSYDALIFGMNKSLYESLEPDLQKIVAKAAKESAVYQVKLNRQKDDTNLKLIKEKGMEVYTPSAAELAKFKEAVAPVYEEYKPILGADLVAKFQALGK